MTEMFGFTEAPEGSEGGFIKPADLQGRLLLIRPKLVERVGSNRTRKNFRTGADEPAPDYDRITADVVVLSGDDVIGDQEVTIPHVVKDMYLSGTKLAPQLKPYIGNADQPYALGRLGKGEAVGQGAAPTVLRPYTAKDAEKATAYLASQAPAL